MTQAVADTLRRAKALIDTPEKWMGPHIHDGCYGRECPITAIYTVCRIENLRAQCFSAFNQEIPTAGIVSWNDAPERTHADVMAAFDAAIAAEEASP